MSTPPDTTTRHEYTDEDINKAWNGVSFSPAHLSVLRAFLSALPERPQSAEIAELKAERNEAKSILQQVDLPDEPLPVQAKRAVDERDYLIGISRAQAKQIEQANRNVAALRAELEQTRLEYSEMKRLHDKAQAELAEIKGYLWPNQTGLPNEHRNALAAIKRREEIQEGYITELRAELTALRQPVLADDGRSLGQVLHEILDEGLSWDRLLKGDKEQCKLAAQAVVAAARPQIEAECLAQAVRRMEAVPVKELAGAAMNPTPPYGLHGKAEAVRARLLAAAKGEQSVLEFKDRKDEVTDNLLDAVKDMLAAWEEQFGEGACDCRPEPENVGHVCQCCKARAVIAAAQGEGQPGDKCPLCGAEEVESNTSRTTYACGSSDYDGRPETFHPGDQCDGQPVVVNEPPHGEKQPDLSGEGEKQDPYADLKAAQADGKIIQMKLKDDPDDTWDDILYPQWVGDPDEYRIKPDQSTFEAHGKTWTRHTPGDPMPCDGDAMVNWLLESEFNGSSEYRHLVSPARRLGEFWFCTVGWRYADEPSKAQQIEAQPTTSSSWTPAVGDVVRPIPEMALGGQIYWRDLAIQLARVWWKCHGIGASLQHGDLDKGIAFSVVCKRHGGRVFHGDTPENAWHKAEDWLMSPDRENFPDACLTPAKP